MLQRLMFGVMYRIGFTPWEGHALPARLTGAVEGPSALPPGRAIDLGCGTGDTSLYLARHGWDVTAIDFVEAALRKARAKGRAAGARVQWIRGDVTRLGSYGVHPPFHLCVDSGCLHALSDRGRAAYVREVNAVAAPGAVFLIAAFADNPKRRGPRGIAAPEIARLLAYDWEFVVSEKDPEISNDPGDPIYIHELRRR
jgi:SAM-dependent methyltransferase